MEHVHRASLAEVSRCPQCMAMTRRLLSRGRRVSNRASRPTLASGETSRAAPRKTSPAGKAGTQPQRPEKLNQGRRLLLKGGTILTMDRSLGNFATGDVLLDGKKIAAVGPNLDVGDADVLDAANMIVMPGFIDTHRHMWQGELRMIVPDGDLGTYLNEVLVAVAPSYKPEDVYASNLLSAVGALNAGITSILDWSHISNTSDHSDAAVEALRDSGIRAVYGYSHSNNGELAWWTDDSVPYPEDVKRIRDTYFSSNDQLVTLAMAVAGPEFASPEIAAKEWNIAREMGCRITTHIGVSTFGQNRKFEELSKLVKLGDDATYIHCSTLSDDEWKIIEDTGGTVSLAPQVEMMMGHGMPPIQKALDRGIRPSLSIDVETNVGADMFGQMRVILGLQRALSFEQRLAGQENPPALLGAQDALEFATIEGARANGMDSKTGSLTPGKEADVILLRKDTIGVAPTSNAPGAVVFAMDTSNVDTVIVAGKVMKRNGELLHVDVPAVIARAEETRNGALSASGYVSSFV